MVLNGPTFYADQFVGCERGEPYVGKILVGDFMLTEEQLVELAERYVSDNSYLSSV